MKSWMKFLVSFGTVLGTIIVIVATYFLSWAMSAVFVWVDLQTVSDLIFLSR